MQLNKLEYESGIDTATKYLAEDKSVKAVKFLNKLLDKHPSNDEAWLLLGIAKRRLGKLDDAIKCLQTAADINTSKMEAWGLLTMTYVDKGDLGLAKVIIEKAGRLNPYNPKIQFFRDNLVRVYSKFGPFF
ncbi:MAG: tetratricopeptide repeat protein [Promethearchaeota archaeon]